MSNQLDITESRAICDAATPGPWYADGWATWDDDLGEYVELHDLSPDARFIAHARQALPAALDEIERLRGELAAASKEIGECAEMLDRWHSDYGELLADRDRLQSRCAALEEDLTNERMNCELMTRRAEALERAIRGHCFFCADTICSDEKRVRAIIEGEYPPIIPNCENWQFDEAMACKEGG